MPDLARLAGTGGAGVMLEVVIPGPPVAQGRGQAAPVMRKDHTGCWVPVTKGGRPIVSIRDPQASRSWKGAAQVHMREAMGARSPLEGPLAALIEAIFPCPRSQYRKQRPRPRRWHTGNKDADNIAKAVLDAGNGVLYLDDRQVVMLLASKLVGRQGEAPLVRLELHELDTRSAALGELLAAFMKPRS